MPQSRDFETVPLENDQSTDEGTSLEPDGDEFDLDAIPALEVGFCPVKLPSNTYGAAFAASMSIISSTSNSEVWLVYMPLFSGCLMVIIGQAILVGAVWHISMTVEHDCLGGSEFVRYSCLFVFVVSCLNDAAETLTMHKWLGRVPYSMARQRVKMRKYTEKNDDGRGNTRHISVTRFTTGITTGHRMCLYIFVVAPKVIICVMLLTYGSAYVLHSTNDETLVLNSVAMLFVLEIDDVLYAFTTTDDVKSLIDCMPPLTLTCAESEGNDITCFEFSWPWSSLFLTGAIVVGTFQYWC